MMESFDVTHKGKRGVLYIHDDRMIRLDIGDMTILNTDKVISIARSSNERVFLTWEDKDGDRVGIKLRIISAPVAAIIEKISNF